MKNFDPELTVSLKKLRGDVETVVKSLALGDLFDISAWTHIVEGKLIPRLSPDFPLMAAICGGGSSGKSTLFNSLSGERVSPSGGKAGINRRILVSAPGGIFRNSDFLSTLFEPFGTESRPLRDPQELTKPGCPLYVLNSNVPRNMVLMDTPDFDTGSGGEYVNREVVSNALETADILIYIFTNSNYNNRDNTDFISKMLTGIGMRKSFLVYRAYSGFKDSEIVEHAMTVARNLYGGGAQKHVLGIYRTDEDNEVAAGSKFMELRPARKGDPPFDEALRKTDPKSLRPELLSSIMSDSMDKASGVRRQANISLDKLRLYLDALQTTQSLCIREALRHFPMDRLVKRFIEIWMETDPAHVRAMRKTGNVVGTPVRLISGAVKWVSDFLSGRPGDADAEFRDKVEDDLLSAVVRIHEKIVSPEISVSISGEDPVAERMKQTIERLKRVDGDAERPYIGPSVEKGTIQFRTGTHPVVFEEQKALRRRDWKAVQKAVLSQKEAIIKISEDIEDDLQDLADDFRRRMGFSAKVKQTFSAFLNVVPATVAITYIIVTGDPVGGGGLKVKLSGLFGLNDLYALIAIPATTGLSKADRDQLEEMLAPIAESWLNNKLKTLKDIFEKEITGNLIRQAEEAIAKSENLIPEIEKNIELCRRSG